MKNFKSFLAVAFAAVAVTFASCSKENDTTSSNPEGVKFQVKISIPQAMASRAISDNSDGADLSLVDGRIIFTSTTGAITKVVKIVANDATPGEGEIKVGALASGATIDKVDEGTKVVTFIGAHTADTNPLPANLYGKTLTDIRKATFDVGTIADNGGPKVANVPIYGFDDNLELTGTGDNKVIKANFQVAPIGSRIQISGIKGGDNVKSFTIGGIWINNYIPSMAYGVATDASTIVDNADNDTNYVAAYSVPALCDVETTTGAGIGTKVSDLEYTAGTGKYFAYNVFPNLAPLTKAHLPRIVIRLDNLVDTNDTPHGTKWLTVKGYTGGTLGEIKNFLPGYSYTFGGTDGLKFNLDNVDDKPEQGEVKGEVIISTMKWKDELVTPEF